MQTSSTAAIILAAGSSSRMGAGRHKLLLPLGEKPVLAHVIEATLLSRADPIIVVLGHQAHQVRTQLAAYINQPTITFIDNPAYAQGMSTSLHTGLQALMNRQHQVEQATSLDSAIILLGDQPLITPSILDSLITTRQTTGKQIIAPLYEGRRGNPILFAADLWPELLEVTGDEGGRSIIERHRQDLATVEVGTEAACFDVDTWEAYQKMVDQWPLIL